MTNQTFLTVAGAFAAAVGSAQAGINFLPIDDGYRAILSFTLGILVAFLAALLKPPTGPQVPANPEPKP